MPDEQLPPPADPSVVTAGAFLHLTADEMRTKLAASANEARALKSQYGTLITSRGEKVDRFYRDVGLLNDILNEAADAADLCDKYEEAIAEVNRQCELIKLTGRNRQVRVRVEVEFHVEASGGTTDDDIIEVVHGFFYTGLDHHADIEQDPITEFVAHTPDVKIVDGAY